MDKYGSCKILKNNDQKLLRANIDLNLRFSHYILQQCRKAGKKPSALTIIFKFMSIERQRVLMKYFIESQFAYCHLAWMYCDKTSHNRINHLHELALRTVYNGNVSTFEKSLEKHNPATVHVRNVKILATELYKTKENLAASIIHKICEQRNIQYNFCTQTDFHLRWVKTVNCGLRTLRYLENMEHCSFWVEKSETLKKFKMKIKSWKPMNCLCNLCQPYFHCLGYILKAHFYVCDNFWQLKAL